jgi:hypothetical protein
MELRRPPSKCHRAAQIPPLHLGEKRRRLFVVRDQDRIGGSADAGRRAFVVAAQFVDRVIPAQPLMIDGLLDEGERARLGFRAFVLDAAEQPGRTGEAAIAEDTQQFELRVGRSLDPPEHFEHVPIVEARDAVAGIARLARPLPFRHRLGSLETVRRAESTQAADPHGDLAVTG